MGDDNAGERSVSLAWNVMIEIQVVGICLARPCLPLTLEDHNDLARKKRKAKHT
jgi:hypothetical protein